LPVIYKTLNLKIQEEISLKSTVKAAKKAGIDEKSENRNMELMYMSQYMAVIINKERLTALKLTG
jgi:hypothetical protein